MIQTAQHNPDERAARLRAWAMATAAAPDDRTIVIPAEFNREEAFLALELAQEKRHSSPLSSRSTTARGGQPTPTPLAFDSAKDAIPPLSLRWQSPWLCSLSSPSPVLLP